MFLKKKLFLLITQHFKKGVRYFTKKLQQNSKQNENSLFSISKEMNKAKTSGKRKKNWQINPSSSDGKKQKGVQTQGQSGWDFGHKVKGPREQSTDGGEGGG